MPPETVILDAGESEIKTERTKINVVALERLLPLGLLKLDDANIQSIAAIVDVAADLGRPVNSSDETLISVAPAQVEVPEELLQRSGVLLPVLKVLLLRLPVARRLVLGRLLCQQLRKPLRQAHSATALSGNGSARLVHGALEATGAAKTHELLRYTSTSKLVVGVGSLGDDVFVGDGEDPVALVAPLVLALVEADAEGAVLGAVVRHLRGERNTHPRLPSKLDGRTRSGPSHRQRASWPDRPAALNSSFNPVDCCAHDPVGLENSEDIWVGVAAGGDSGGVTMNGDPDDDGSEDRLALVTGGGEAHWQDGT